MQERKLMELAEAAGTIAIVGHVRPDGDCVGSCLAVCNYITEQYPEKTVDVYLETASAWTAETGNAWERTWCT